MKPARFDSLSFNKVWTRRREISEILMCCFYQSLTAKDKVKQKTKNGSYFVSLQLCCITKTTKEFTRLNRTWWQVWSLTADHFNISRWARLNPLAGACSMIETLLNTLEKKSQLSLDIEERSWRRPATCIIEFLLIDSLDLGASWVGYSLNGFGFNSVQVSKRSVQHSALHVV